MIIHHLRAENVLSFGVGDDALDIDLQPGLNMLVGPNGGGKSNVLRALEIVLAHFSDLGGLRAAYPPAPPHKPIRPNARIRIACDVEWDTSEERALWAAFLVGSLVPRGPWELPQIETDSEPAKSWPVDEQRLNQYLAAIGQLDFTGAVALLSRQQLVVEVEGSTGRAELAAGLPRLGWTVEITRGGWLHPSSQVTGRSSPVRLSDLYVRTLGKPLRAEWKAFWDGTGLLPRLPPFDWRQCLQGLAERESVALEPFAGSHMVPLEWPQAVWPLLKIDPQMAIQHAIQWRTIVGTLVRGGYVRWDRWGLQDLARWTPGTALAEYLRGGALGPALMTLASQGHQGQTAYRTVCHRFQELTNTSLAYHVLDPTPAEEEPPPTNVQAVTGDDIPIQESGSGRAQAALLLLMLATRGAVLALDEPEQAMHPVLQARLARQWVEGDAQTLIVTHSPYLLPLGHLECLKHVQLDRGTGCSRVTPRPLKEGEPPANGISQAGACEPMSDEHPSESLTTLSPATLAKQLRWPGDGLWLFARVVVLVEGQEDAAALSVWFDKWLARRKSGDGMVKHTGASLGVLFWPAGGNTGIIPQARILDRFEIPWVALYDADTLSSQSHRRGTNRKVWQWWRDYGLVTEAPDAFEKLSFPERFAMFPMMVQSGRPPQIFLRGTTQDDNLDTLPEVEKHRSEAETLVMGGPNLFRQIAEDTDPPAEFRGLFRSVLAMGGEGLPVHRTWQVSRRTWRLVRRTVSPLAPGEMS